MPGGRQHPGHARGSPGRASHVAIMEARNRRNKKFTRFDYIVSMRCWEWDKLSQGNCMSGGDFNSGWRANGSGAMRDGGVPNSTNVCHYTGHHVAGRVA